MIAPAPPPGPGAGIDPRAPRFSAAIVATLLLVVIALALSGTEIAAALLFGVLTLLFAWGAFAGVRRHPFGWVFRRLLRPRLGPPTALEDPVPPTFAQGVGFAITAVGLLLGLAGVPFAIVVAASAAFVAAFLNAAFDYCLGCQIYLLLVRTRLLGRRRSRSTSSSAI